MTNRAILQRNKKYSLFDYFAIPAKVVPFHMAAKILARLAAALIPSIQALAIAGFVDAVGAVVQGALPVRAVYGPIIVLALIVAYSYLSSSLMNTIEESANLRMDKVLRAEMLEQKASLRYRYIEDADTWDLLSRTCKNFSNTIMSGLNAMLNVGEIAVRIISLLAILISEVSWAALTILVVSVPLFFLAYRGGKEIYQTSVLAAKSSRRAAYLHEVLTDRQAAYERTVFGYSDSVNADWQEKYETARKANLRTNIRFYVRMKSSSICTVGISIFITGVLAHSVLTGDLSAGLFAGLVTASFSLVQTMSWTFTRAMGKIAEQKEFLKDLTKVMGLERIPGALDSVENAGPFPIESIEFRHVSFRYPGTEKEILKDLSFVWEKGKTYALVGANGAGKTTITKLLTGLYDQYEGEIKINGRSLRTYSQAQLKGMFAVVYQDFCKYAVSIRQNFQLGNAAEFDEKRAYECLEVFGLADKVRNMPLQLDTPLGKIIGDQDFSGGEWQRLVLARTLYSNAPVSVLDEPTAALDPIAESELYSQFGKISRGKTTILITHRLGAARMADEILVIAGGRTAESGTHQELMEQGGIYAGMFNSQKEWYVV